MKIAFTIGLSLVLAPVLSAVGGDGPTGKVVRTTLSAVRQTPDAFRNVWVRFDVQFASMGKVSNPFFTQFVPSRYANFYTWADEQEIWKQGQYEDLFGLLFIAKDNNQASSLYSAEVYQRIEITGIVRNTFQGEPWIEVTSFEMKDKKVNTSSLSHLYRGESHMDKRRWKPAIAELSLAPGGELPDHVLSAIHKNLAMCYLRLGESETAISHLESAVDLVQTVDQEVRQMAELARVRPESFLDRNLGDAQIVDHTRPMWEAFGRGEDAADPAAPIKK